MVSARDTFRPRSRDTKVMFAVHYEDGRSAYIRVSPEAARDGHMVVMSIAREQQKAGDIPDGTIRQRQAGALTTTVAAPSSAWGLNSQESAPRLSQVSAARPSSGA